MSNTSNNISNALIHLEQYHPGESRVYSNARLIPSNSIDATANTVNLREVYGASEIGKKIHSKKASYIASFGSALFISIVIIIAVLVVCLTTPEENKPCYVTIRVAMDSNSFEHDSNPYSLVTGDFNHDKMVDIAVINSGTNNIGIFINYGNISFVLKMRYSTGNFSKPISAAVGDFNNDTHLDIAVANYNSHNIGIFLGHGDGSFSSQRIFSTDASRPLSITIGDLNNDHWLDIVIANNGTNDIGILFGYGNGSFGKQITFPTGYDSFPSSVVVADINHDQNLDIVVANYGTDNVGIFLGYGNGSCTLQTIYSTGRHSHPCSIAINDVNHDGQLDIIVANSGTNNVGIFLGYGNGSFVTQVTYSVSPDSYPHSIIIGDFNQDKQLDIAVSNYYTDNISIFIGYSNGSFATPTMHSTGIESRPCGLTTSDFDNDNQLDIAVANFYTNNILIFIGYRMIQSENPTVYSTGNASQPSEIVSGDFNNDTHIDLVTINSGTNTISVFLGYGNGSFQEQTTYSTGYNFISYSLAVGDLDNDHRLDIVVANYKGESLGILYGYGNGTFATVVTYFTGDSSTLRWVIINDFNNDLHQDIVFADYGTNDIGIFLGNGNRTFKTLMKYSTGNNSRPYSIDHGDFNNDGHLDIVVVNSGTDNIGIFLGFGNGNFTLLTTYSNGISPAAEMITVVDLNKDNYLDIIVANTNINNIRILFGFGNGSFGTQVIYSTSPGFAPCWISVADFNDDHLSDLIIANRVSNNVGIFLGNRQGYFGSQTMYSTGIGSGPVSIVIGDFNKDNRLDIAVANYGTNNVAILLGHPNKDAANQTDNMTDIDSQLSSATINNFNHENQSNFINANWITDDNPVLLGYYYSNFYKQTTYSTGSSFHPYSIAIGDLNNDTQMDIIVANSGNGSIGILLQYNSETFGSEMIHSVGVSSSPQNVFIDDFNNDNQLDIAVTNPISDTVIVLLGDGNGTFSTEITYSTGSGSKPSALATGNFNNDKYLDLVVANEGTNTIGVFFGLDYTVFERQEPSPNNKDLAPFSMAIGDFNNDGYLDIVAAFYDTQNIGISLGYGNGTFTPLMTYADVPLSRPYAVAVGDFNNDNQLDITVANWGLNSISIILGNGDGTFTKPILYSTGSNTRPLSIAVGDFNNDKYLDITTANYGGNSISIFLGHGDGTFQDAIILSTGKNSGPNSVTISDINNDTQLDIIVANEVLNNVGVFLGFGNGSFAEQLTTPTGTNSAPWYAIARDFNNDGQLDLAIANYGTDNIGILYGYGNGSFGNLQTYTTGDDSQPKQVDVGDFNNDNQLDIIVAVSDGVGVGILFGYGDGTFTSISTVSTELGPANIVVVGDFNSDNHLDFATISGSIYNIKVFLAHGNKPFGGQTTFFVGENSRPSSIAIGHFNNDNHLDIAVANSGTNNIGILSGYGNRMFSNAITYSTGFDSNPLSLATGDFNNDSLTDIAVANTKTNNIIVLIRYDNGSFSNFISYPMEVGSQPVSVAIGDFNKDYKLDIAVANYGTNNICILFGSGNGTFPNQIWYPLDYDSRPKWIMFKDLNNDGWEDIIVAAYGIDNIKILLNPC